MAQSENVDRMPTREEYELLQAAWDMTATYGFILMSPSWHPRKVFQSCVREGWIKLEVLGRMYELTLLPEGDDARYRFWEYMGRQEEK